MRLKKESMFKSNPHTHITPCISPPCSFHLSHSGGSAVSTRLWHLLWNIFLCGINAALDLSLTVSWFLVDEHWLLSSWSRDHFKPAVRKKCWGLVLGVPSVPRAVTCAVLKDSSLHLLEVLYVLSTGPRNKPTSLLAVLAVMKPCKIAGTQMHL